jgi:hypothetical protein
MGAVAALNGAAAGGSLNHRRSETIQVQPIKICKKSYKPANQPELQFDIVVDM